MPNRELYPVRRVDPDSAKAAKELLTAFRSPDGEITLSRERADNLELTVCEALHALRNP